jgi:hypothetical protein
LSFLFAFSHTHIHHIDAKDIIGSGYFINHGRTMLNKILFYAESKKRSKINIVAWKYFLIRSETSSIDGKRVANALDDDKIDKNSA